MKTGEWFGRHFESQARMCSVREDEDIQRIRKRGVKPSHCLCRGEQTRKNKYSEVFCFIFIVQPDTKRRELHPPPPSPGGPPALIRSMCWTWANHSELQAPKECLKKERGEAEKREDRELGERRGFYNIERETVGGTGGGGRWWGRWRRNGAPVLPKPMYGGVQ